MSRHRSRESKTFFYSKSLTTGNVFAPANPRLVFRKRGRVDGNPHPHLARSSDRSVFGVTRIRLRRDGPDDSDVANNRFFPALVPKSYTARLFLNATTPYRRARIIITIKATAEIRPRAVRHGVVVANRRGPNERKRCSRLVHARRPRRVLSAAAAVTDDDCCREYTPCFRYSSATNTTPPTIRKRPARSAQSKQCDSPRCLPAAAGMSSSRSRLTLS